MNLNIVETGEPKSTTALATEWTIKLDNKLLNIVNLAEGIFAHQS